MSDLTTFRDHCRRMATAQHTDECPARRRPYTRPGRCAGCLSPADRKLFAALADQVDAYLTGDLGGLNDDQDQPFDLGGAE